MRGTEIVIFSPGEEAFGNDLGMPEKMRKATFKSATFGLISSKWLAQPRSYFILEVEPAGASLALGQAGILGPWEPAFRLEPWEQAWYWGVRGLGLWRLLGRLGQRSHLGPLELAEAEWVRSLGLREPTGSLAL